MKVQQLEKVLHFRGRPYTDLLLLALMGISMYPVSFRPAWAGEATQIVGALLGLSWPFIVAWFSDCRGCPRCLRPIKIP